MVCCTLPSRAASSTPARPDSAAARAKTVAMGRPIGTPARRAASRLLPIAISRRPNTVQARTPPPASSTASIHSVSTGTARPWRGRGW